MRPRAGGEYVYLREAFGPEAAFLTGWTSFVAGFSGASRRQRGGAGRVHRAIRPRGGDSTPLLTIPLPLSRSSSRRSRSSRSTAIAALTLIHIRGLGPGSVLQNVLAGLKATALSMIIALGFAIGSRRMPERSCRGTPASRARDAARARAGHVLRTRAGTPRPMWPRKCGTRVATCRSRSRSAPAPVIVLYVAFNALYLLCAAASPSSPALRGGRLLDVVGRAAVRVCGRQPGRRSSRSSA